MTRGALGLAPGSRSPGDAAERDALLRRVPEVALLPEFTELRFGAAALSVERVPTHEARIARLADEPYRARLQDALACLVARAATEDNGGLDFVARSLLHFVRAIPPERHPLIVALYFASLGAVAAGGDGQAPPADELARAMDEYEAALPEEGERKAEGSEGPA